MLLMHLQEVMGVPLMKNMTTIGYSMGWSGFQMVSELVFSTFAFVNMDDE